jgi:hypothetical protein
METIITLAFAIAAAISLSYAGYEGVKWLDEQQRRSGYDPKKKWGR